MNNKTATLLLEEERFEKGANTPNIHKEYLCPCGQGKIVEERVPGFGDWYTQIECPQCQKKYDLIEGCGCIWELREK